MADVMAYQNKSRGIKFTRSDRHESSHAKSTVINWGQVLWKLLQNVYKYTDLRPNEIKIRNVKHFIKSQSHRSTLLFEVDTEGHRSNVLQKKQ